MLALIRIGRWDDALATLARMNEFLGDRWDEPPGFALRAYGGAAFLLDCMGNRGAADRYLNAWPRLRDARPSPLGVDLSWLGETLARRGQFERARTILHDVDPNTSRQNAGPDPRGPLRAGRRGR